MSDADAGDGYRYLVAGKDNPRRGDWLRVDAITNGSAGYAWRMIWDEKDAAKVDLVTDVVRRAIPEQIEDSDEFVDLRKIAGTSHFYGDIYTATKDGSFFWSIQDHDGISWTEIPEYLYNALNKYDADLRNAGYKDP
jgi:hypothetical protein